MALGVYGGATTNMNVPDGINTGYFYKRLPHKGDFKGARQYIAQPIYWCRNCK